ncbi:MAG: biopolymer transporter ExbB [Pseudomonadota bacterium]
MEQSEQRGPQFTQPVRQIALMLIICGLVGFGAYLLFPAVAPVFLSNLYLNGFIAFVFVIGVLACFWQVTQLVSSVNWIEGFAAENPGHELVKPPRLLASLAALLRRRGARMEIGTSSSRSILDSVATRMDEARDITRYITNLLIFLGLLGTFYGLATTVPAVVDTIRSLNPQEGEDPIEVFDRLMTGLEAQLGGMGTAFASSLLGLAGSLVVGLLELFAGHGQNRFYRELEEWLSTITRVGFSAGDVENAGEVGGVAGAMAELGTQLAQMQDQALHQGVISGELDDRLERLAVSVEMLASGLEQQKSGVSDDRTEALLARIADGQDRVAAAFAERGDDGNVHGDAESRMRLRSIDVQLLRILEEMSAGRQESMSDLRNDINALTKIIRQAVHDDSGGQG